MPEPALSKTIGRVLASSSTKSPCGIWTNNGVAFLDFVVQVIGYEARGRFTLHTDAVAFLVPRLRQAVLTDAVVLRARDAELHTDILTSAKGRQGLTILGNEIERTDAVAFIDLAMDDERLVPAPTAGLFRTFGVESIFATDHDFGKLLISGCPGGHDLRRGGFPEDDADGRHEMFADDGIVFGKHLETGMFVRNAFDHTAEAIEVIDIRGVHQDGGREASCLSAVALIGGVEDIPQFGLGIEEFPIEGLRDGFAMLLQDGNGGADDLSMSR